MASTYTDRNRYEKQGDGENENDWGQRLNSSFDLMDVADDGYYTVDVSAGNVTLTTGDNATSAQARYRTLKIIGDLAAGSTRTITIPDREKWYNIVVEISGSGTVDIKNTSDSTGVTISAGTPNLSIVCDGTSTNSMLGTDGLLVAANNLSDLTNASAARDNLGITGTNTSAIFEVIYPVGSIYQNYNDGTNPGTLIGFGTWVSVATGRTLVGAGTGQDINAVTSTFTATSTGGAYYHQMTVDEMPSHNHQIYYNATAEEQGSGSPKHIFSNPNAYTSTGNMTSAGGDQPHYNQQPYVVVYMWRRTA